MTRVRRGQKPSPELVENFKERYRVIGGSPLLRITREQAAAVATALEEAHPGQAFRPYVGMRFWHPLISEVLEEMAADGVRRAVALIMSPQYSPILMKGYLDAVDEANQKLAADGRAVDVHFVETWWDAPLYQEAVAERIQATLSALPESVRKEVPLLLTAHSIPRSVYDRDPDYVEQLKATVRQIAERVDHPSRFAYQSAGHTHEEWLRPDMVDIFPELAAEGHKDVVISPVQFLSDHLEILYDIDVAARKQAADEGLTLHRTESLNTHPKLIAALAAQVEERAVAAAWL